MELQGSDDRSGELDARKWGAGCDVAGRTSGAHLNAPLHLPSEACRHPDVYVYIFLLHNFFVLNTICNNWIAVVCSSSTVPTGRLRLWVQVSSVNASNLKVSS